MQKAMHIAQIQNQLTTFFVQAERLNCKRSLPDGVWREISNCCFTFTTQVFRQLSRHKLAGHRAPGKDVVSIHSSLFVVLKLFSGAHGPWSWDAIIQWFLPHDRELKNTYQFLFWILLSGVKPTWSESDKLISLNFKFLFWCLKKTLYSETLGEQCATYDTLTDHQYSNHSRLCFSSRLIETGCKWQLELEQEEGSGGRCTLA